MESKQVKILIDKFFEGETTLEEEHLLEIYFQQDEIAESFLPFQSYFVHTRSVQSVSINKQLSLPKKTFLSVKQQRIASIAVVGLTVFWLAVYDFNQPTKEELAFSTFKENMFLMADQFNRAEQDITYVNYLYNTSNQSKK
jgi:hypothetical protein